MTYDLGRALRAVADADVSQLVKKDAEYGSSWKKRGGVGAFMMAARKWDRLEMVLQGRDYDIFKVALADTREEGILDDIGDLRRYLMLIEAEIRDRMTARAPVPNGATGVALADRDEWSSRPGP